MSEMSSITRAILVATAKGRTVEQIATDLTISSTLVHYIIDTPLAKAEVARLQAILELP